MTTKLVERQGFAERQDFASLPSGFTLTELLVVVAIIGVMLGLTMPAFNTMVKSQRISSTQTLIRSALTQAQVYAAANQGYAGIRFQQDLNGKQYVVLIEYSHNNGTIMIFKPVPNVRPTALPEGIGLISGEIDAFSTYPEKDLYLDDNNIDDPHCLLDANTFTIVFSPTGQLINKTLIVHPCNDADNTINVEIVVNTGNALLYCDGWYTDRSIPTVTHPPMSWCATAEISTTRLYIYETEFMKEANPNFRFSEYAHQMEAILINAYNGTIIDLADFY
ncbi:Tfp pilus assembly protein FimT/FimU [Planctomycetota bacterium]